MKALNLSAEKHGTTIRILQISEKRVDAASNSRCRLDLEIQTVHISRTNKPKRLIIGKYVNKRMVVGISCHENTSSYIPANI